MAQSTAMRDEQFRLWLVDTGGWQPVDWTDAPQHATAVMPMIPHSVDWPSAARLLELHNKKFLDTKRGGGGRHWLMAIPVRVRYEGDPEEGQLIRLDSTDKGARLG